MQGAINRQHTIADTATSYISVGPLPQGLTIRSYIVTALSGGGENVSVFPALSRTADADAASHALAEPLIYAGDLRLNNVPGIYDNSTTAPTQCAIPINRRFDDGPRWLIIAAAASGGKGSAYLLHSVTWDDEETPQPGAGIGTVSPPFESGPPAGPVFPVEPT